MIANAAVQALIATDRETLIELMAVAYARGGYQLTHPGDPDVRALLDEARIRNERPDRWYNGVHFRSTEATKP